MSVEEMDNMFEVLFNNISSNQAPGLNSYEKSIFLTKGQDEILKNHFNPESKGNNTQDGFDANQKRQIDFSMLTTVYDLSKITGKTDSSTKKIDTALFDIRSNSKSVFLPVDMMMAINEIAVVTRNDQKNVALQVIPIKFDEYSRLMSKPFKRPLKYQAWRLINNDERNKADIIIGPSDTLTNYILRYIRRPNPIILSDLDGLSINGYKGQDSNGNLIPSDDTTTTEIYGIPCELDPILHEEIVQRAVELAKIAWVANDANSIQLETLAGQRSE